MKTEFYLDFDGLEKVYKLPSWYVAPVSQMRQAKKMWPGVQLPNPPRVFKARSRSEVLLLHVPDNFNSLWRKVHMLYGYAKRREGLMEDSDSYRVAVDKPVFDKPVWLGFDPERNRGEPVPYNSYWSAASEVLSAMIQFPDWPLEWLNVHASPILAGYELRSEDGGWNDVPVLDMSEYKQLGMTLSRIPKDATDIYRATPSVRSV